jgi:hypothetical protein
MLAAKVVERAGIWSRPAAAPVARALRRVEVPPEWREEWQRLPEVEHASSRTPDEEVAVEDLEIRFDEAMEAMGLDDDQPVLSPAQRREAGLVRRRRRRRRLAGLVAAGLGVVALSSVVAYAVASLDEPPPPAPTVTTAPPTTLALEATPVTVPADGLGGTQLHRGGYTRSGTGRGGFLQPIGRYWVTDPGGFFATDPVAYGKLLYPGSSTDDRLVALHMEDGSVTFEVATGDRVRSEPAVQQLAPPPTWCSVRTTDGCTPGMR